MRYTITALLLLIASQATAHPVPRGVHGRQVLVHVDADRVRVEYRLDVDQWTVVFRDLPEFVERDQLAKMQTPTQFFTAYLQAMAPIVAGNLTATLDDEPLTLKTIGEPKYQSIDAHLQCLFVYEAAWTLKPGRDHRFRFRDGTFIGDPEPGPLDLTLADGPGIRMTDRVEPSAELKAKPIIERGPGDEAKLRIVSATLSLVAPSKPVVTPSEASPPPAETTPTPPTEVVTAEAKAPAQSRWSILELMDSQLGLIFLIPLAAAFGAIHALTPGHGKTMVAAYLVGERGTMSHAFLLGMVTTITHTGSVMIVAALLWAFFPKAVPADVQPILGFAGGLLLAGLGIWLLLTRLAGQPDHVHLPGTGHHHHPDGHHHHHHHAPEPTTTGEAPSWWALVILGVSGGLIPCWDAIAMLGFAIAANRLALALPLLAAFSAGLAAVLVAIGIAVVQLKRFASGRFGEGRFFRVLPMLSAAAITILGLWLCRESLISPQ